MITDNEMLFKKWVHSQEEDSGDELVYRPETYNFPLRRGGRDAIDLKADKSYIKRDSAYDDKYSRAEGCWVVEGDDTLAFETTDGSLKSKLKIISLTDDKLVIKKE